MSKTTSRFDDVVKLLCTNNGNVVSGEVLEYHPSKSLVVSVNRQIKLTLRHNGKLYVGNQAGLEFTSTGPEEFVIKEGR
jgi:hypothetical protein